VAIVAHTHCGGLDTVHAGSGLLNTKFLAFFLTIKVHISHESTKMQAAPR
jgi:hypothetical protein